MSSLFFRLPRELRDFVYFYYVYEPEGYHYDATHNRLRTASGQPIDLALQYASKAIAGEMEGLPFQFNKITFTTVLDETLKAQKFKYLLREQQAVFKSILFQNYTCFTPEILEKLAAMHPDGYTLEVARGLGLELRENRLKNLFPQTTGKLSSITRCLLEELVHIAEATPKLMDEEETPGYTLNLCDNQRVIIAWRPILWSQPDENELFPLVEHFSDYYPDKFRAIHMKHYYSATTAALNFLQSIDKKAKSHLRLLIIKEDHQSVASPECHAQGLIPFCQEFPNLRIERRVDIWNTAMVSLDMLVTHYYFSGRGNTVDVSSAFENTARWMNEAMLLQSLGMPQGSFSLIFDGPPGTKQQLWDSLKRVAAVQDASWELSRQGIDKPFGYLVKKLARPYLHMTKQFSNTIREMILGNSCIQLHTFKGTIWDVEEVKKAIVAVGSVAYNIDHFFLNETMDESELEDGYAGIVASYWPPSKSHQEYDLSLDMGVGLDPLPL